MALIFYKSVTFIISSKYELFFFFGNSYPRFETETSIPLFALLFLTTWQRPTFMQRSLITITACQNISLFKRQRQRWATKNTYKGSSFILSSNTFRLDMAVILFFKYKCSDKYYSGSPRRFFTIFLKVLKPGKISGKKNQM